MAFFHDISRAFAALRSRSESAVYHVAYDLRVPGQDYEKVITEITRTPNVQILKSSWLVETTEGPTALCDRIKAAADANDRFFISEVRANVSSAGLTDEIRDWLGARVR
jgi:hypothetical protein